MKLENFRSDIADIPHTDDPGQVRRKSRDFTNSPILREEAEGKVADLLVMPRSRNEVLKVASACARHRVPLIARGAGTANFGQGIPMAGGIILDMTNLTKVLWVKDRKVRVEPGVPMLDLDEQLRRDHGLELRMHPSTRKSTLGGYIAGGHVGIGSCAYGILHDRGNIVALEAISVEEEPRIVEVRGSEVNRLHHAYGTNGIITQLEMPLAPAYRWLEAIVEFPDFMQVVRFLIDFCQEQGVIKKLATGNGWPLPDIFQPLAHYVTPGYSTAHVMVADEFREIFLSMVKEAGGRIVYEGLEGQGPFKMPLYEFSFGHVRRQIDRLDPSLIANFGMFPAEDLVGCIKRIRDLLPDAPFALDMKRKDGILLAQGSPYFPYVDAANFARRVEEFQALGYIAANVHTFFVRENGMKVIDESEVAFKRAMDPYDLMNRGKFTSDDVEKPGVGASLPTIGWKYRKAGELAENSTEIPFMITTRTPYQATLRSYSKDELPPTPYTDTYCTPLSDGTQVELPIEPLPGTEQAIVLLMSNQTPFVVEEKLAQLLTQAVADLRPEVIVAVPTMGLDYARLVAANLGHEHYVALGNSRKFWYSDELSVPVQSVTSPGVTKKLYLDPALLSRVAGKRTLIIDDVIATGGTASAALDLMLHAGANVVGLGFVFSEGDPWKNVLAAIGPEWPGKVHVVGEIPRLTKATQGWIPVD